MKKLMLVLCSVLLLSFQSSAFASIVSDAPLGPYGQASHSTRNLHDGSVWQRLGESSAIDDGVLWRTDGGLFANDAVSVGDTVEIQFEFWTAGWGLHTYDQLVAWADTDHQDGFENDEMLIYEKRYKESDAINRYYDNTNDDFTYYYATLDITEDMFDGFWLRSRVHCNHDADIRNNQTGYLSQGEVEDWFIQVNPAPVPEPATMLLLGTGLVGLAGLRRKKN